MMPRGRIARPVPLGAGQLQDVLDGEIPFGVCEDRGLDLGFVVNAFFLNSRSSRTWSGSPSRYSTDVCGRRRAR